MEANTLPHSANVISHGQLWNDGQPLDLHCEQLLVEWTICRCPKMSSELHGCCWWLWEFLWNASQCEQHSSCSSEPSMHNYSRIRQTSTS